MNVGIALSGKEQRINLRRESSKRYNQTARSFFMVAIGAGNDCEDSGGS
jgi:hypothetical protein